MAGNDLLHGFQAGMQAFAPLVNATLQRQKDERDTAAHMAQLRLQSELQGGLQEKQNSFTTARDTAQNSFTTARDTAQNSFTTARDTAQNSAAINAAALANQNSVTQDANRNVFTASQATLAANARADAATKATEAAKDAAATLAAGSVEEIKLRARLQNDALEHQGTARMLTLKAVAKQLREAKTTVADSVSSPEAKTAARESVWAIETDLALTADAHGALLEGVKKTGNPAGLFAFMDRTDASLPSFAPKPTTKTYTLTDSLTGEQQVYLPVSMPDGTVTLKRVPKEGAAPAASGIPGAFGTPKPTPNRPAGAPPTGAVPPRPTGAVPPRPAGAPTSKYWNTPVPATP